MFGSIHVPSEVMKTDPRIVIAGGSGFLGRLLSQHFAALGYEVTVLTRSSKSANAKARGRGLEWDGKTLGPWTKVLEGAVALINLAGRSVNCRYHAANRREIMDSRVDSTRVLGEAIALCAEPPGVWLNSSTATIYKHSLDREMDESGVIGATAEAKDAFSVEVACAWEKVFNDAITPRTRKVALRTAMVFAPEEGGVFRVLRRLVRLGLGGRMGSGEQFVSWIHDRDFCRAIEWLIAYGEFTGHVNVSAPSPVRNREMMRLFRELYGIRIGLPATEWMLEAGAVFLRTETELVLKSRCVIPKRLLEAGFEFKYPRMKEAVEEIESRITE